MKDYNNIVWNYYVEYSEDSPSGLIWKVNRGSNKCSGQTAGSLRNDGYFRLKFSGDLFFIHRIIWILHYGSIEQNLQIDHIDGVRSNNKISNLRLVDSMLNNRNSCIRHDNTSGKTGVWLCNKKGVPYYESFVMDNLGKRRYKSFNINKLGQDKAFEMACQWRGDRIAELDGYTDRHGK